MPNLDGFESYRSVCKLLGLGRVTIWRMTRDGTFPKPVPISPGRVGFPRRAVHDFITKRMEAVENAT